MDEFSQTEAYRNLVLIGVAPTAALLYTHSVIQANLAALGQSAGEVVSAMPEGSGGIIGSLIRNTLSDPSMPAALLRAKLGPGLQVNIGLVKRVANNRFLFPGSRAFGTPARSFAAPVFKGIGRVFGVVSVINDVKELTNPSESFPGVRVQRSAFLAADVAGLLFSPLRLLPVSARAVDLITEQPFVGQLYGTQGP